MSPNDTNPRSGRRVFTRRQLLLATPAVSLATIGTLLGVTQIRSQGRTWTSAASRGAESDAEQKFASLSANGNSNCSLAFLDSIPSMPDDQRIQGSCCGPMDFERYREQIEGLRKYSAILEVPPDPYDITASLAKRLLDFGKTITPTAEEQRVLDEAVAASDEQGYCCCRCWRWSVYEGLSKYLVRNQRFTAQLITDVLDNSDGCGGGM